MAKKSKGSRKTKKDLTLKVSKDKLVLTPEDVDHKAGVKAAAQALATCQYGPGQTNCPTADCY